MTTRYLVGLDGQFRKGDTYRSPLSCKGCNVGFTEHVILPASTFLVLGDAQVHSSPDFPDPLLMAILLWNGTIVHLSMTVGFLYELQHIDGTYVFV